MGLSLPEERIRLGKAQPFGLEPVSLSPDKDRIAELRDRAREHYEFGEKFSTTERDDLLAVLILGIES